MPVSFPVAFFASRTDNHPRQRTVRWPQLVDRLQQFDEREAKDGPLWSPTLYLPEARRGKDGVHSVSCAVGDFDTGIDLYEIVPRLQERGLAWVAHTTHSHLVEHPKFRVIVPFSRPVPAVEWPATWTRLAHHLFGLALDPAAKDASRIYYLPSHAPGAEHGAFAVEGEALDPASLPDVPMLDEAYQLPPSRGLPNILPLPNTDRAREERYALKALQAECQELSAAGKGVRNNRLNEAAFSLGQLVGAGLLGRGIVEGALEASALACGLVTDDGIGSVRASIKSGLDSGATQPRTLPAPSPERRHPGGFIHAHAQVGGQPVSLRQRWGRV
jgi:hypothetical protein